MNAASTPEFRQILRDLVTEGYKGGSSGGMLKEAWKRYRATYGNKKGLRRAKCRTCGRIHAPGEVKHFHNPRKKKPGSLVCKHCGTHDVKKPRSFKNPIAIYNPPRGEKLPMAVIEIRYLRTGGQYSRELFKHKFKANNRPMVYGLPDGSVLLKGKNKLWGNA